MIQDLGEIEHVIPPEHVILSDSEGSNQEFHTKSLESKWYKPWDWNVNWKTIGSGFTEIGLGGAAIALAVYTSPFIGSLAGPLVEFGLVNIGVGITDIVLGIYDKPDVMDVIIGKNGLNIFDNSIIQEIIPLELQAGAKIGEEFLKKYDELNK